MTAPYPASGVTLAKQLERLDEFAWALHAAASEDAAVYAASGGTTADAKRTNQRIVAARDGMQDVIAAGGQNFIDYAIAQKNGAVPDVAASYTQMISAANAAIAWFKTNYPIGNAEVFQGDLVVPRTLTPADLSGYVAVLASVAATVS